MARWERVEDPLEEGDIRVAGLPHVPLTRGAAPARLRGSMQLSEVELQVRPSVLPRLSWIQLAWAGFIAYKF